jgi:hypothetical protein
MNILLLRPAPSNEQFGLGPFFRIEPLGMEYIGAALESRGHQVTLRDLRFSPPVETILETVRPDLVGVACMHALEIDDVRDVVSRIRNARPKTFLIVGGHSAAAYPEPFFDASVDGICWTMASAPCRNSSTRLPPTSPSKRFRAGFFVAAATYIVHQTPRKLSALMTYRGQPGTLSPAGGAGMRACTIARPT